jgi:SWI/SNF-related matrix-associated actin-dependent regulator of chromatin subfamily A3
MRTHSKYSYEHLITGSKRQVIPDNNLGGIISDEMGMGKSLTMLSAIVGSLATAEYFAQSGRRDLASKGVRKPAAKATLVVVPSACKWLLIALKFVWHGAPELILARNLVLLDAWIEEVQKYDKAFRTVAAVANYTPRHILPNTLNMHKYHGPKRELDPLKLLDFDIIFTTYATAAAEFRRGSNVLHNINWFRIVLDEGRFASQSRIS